MYWFVLKNDKQWLVYDWDIAKIDFCLDQLEAITWNKKKPGNIKYQSINIWVFNQKRKFFLPLDEHKKTDENITQKFFEYLANNARYKMLSDKSYGIWQETLKHYDVYKRWNYVFFEKKEKKSEYSISLSGKAKAKFLMVKELLDWNIKLKPYEYNYKWNKKDIKIWHNYSFKLFNKKVFVPGNYTNALRLSMFKENVLTKKPGTNMEWLLQARQYDVLLKTGRVTAFVAPRRWGKTFLLAFMALSEIIKEYYNVQSRFRPTTVIYVWLTAAKNQAVVQYIKKMVSRMWTWAKLMFDRNPTLKAYEFKSGKDLIGSIKFVSVNDDDPGIGDYADCIIVDEWHRIPRHIVEWLWPIVQNEWAKFITASTLYPDLPKNWFYDFVVKWETSVFNIEKEVENTYNVYEELFKKIYDWEHNHNDLSEYNEVVEKRVNKIDYVWMRYTYDDIEYIPEWRKEKTKKEEYEKNPKKFIVSFYSRFPDEGKVFDYEVAIKRPEHLIEAPYRYIIIGYDPASTKDYSAVVVMWYNEYQNKLVLLEEHELNKTWRIEDQVEQIVKIKKLAEKYVYEDARKKTHTFFVMDATQKSTAEILEMKWFRVDCKVSYHKWNNINTNTIIKWEHLVPKKYLVEVFQDMLDNKKMFINKDMNRIQSEMDNFKSKLMASGYIKYEAEWWKTDEWWLKINDDFINAWMLCNYYACNVLWLKYKMFKDVNWIADNKVIKMTRSELAKYHKEILLNERKKKELDLSNDKNESYYSKFIY